MEIKYDISFLLKLVKIVKSKHFKKLKYIQHSNNN